MFFPKPPFENTKRALIIAPLPEWNFFSNRLSSATTFRWLNFNVKKATNECFLVGPLFGAPQLAFLLDILISKGLEEIIFIGWGGRTPRSSLTIGDLLLPERAISLSGVTKFFYNRKKIFTINHNVKRQIEKGFCEHFITYKTGVILSVDSPLVVERELDRYNFYLSRAQAMDMETSTLYGLAQYYGLKACALIMITDEVGTLSLKRVEGSLRKLREELIPFLKTFIEEGFFSGNEKV